MSSLPLLSVIIVTYNHENYIEQTIKSALNQKTDFNYEIIIGEDCSTDKTREICEKLQKENQDKIVLLDYKENKGLINNYLSCFERARGKFIAILEGDDYWIDKFKLQKQINVIEESDDIGLVHTAYKIYNETSNSISDVNRKLINKAKNLQGFNLYEMILSNNFICAGTVIFRRDVLSTIDFEYFKNKNCNTVDFIIWPKISLNYRIRYIEDFTFVYRILNSSISNSIDFNKIEKFNNTKLEIIKYYLIRYPSSKLDFKFLEGNINAFLFLKALKLRKIKKALYYLTKINFLNLIHVYKSWSKNV